MSFFLAKFRPNVDPDAILAQLQSVFPQIQVVSDNWRAARRNAAEAALRASEAAGVTVPNPSAVLECIDRADASNPHGKEIRIPLSGNGELLGSLAQHGMLLNSRDVISNDPMVKELKGFLSSLPGVEETEVFDG
jgi:hypothetical protein